MLNASKIGPFGSKKTSAYMWQCFYTALIKMDVIFGFFRSKGMGKKYSKKRNYGKVVFWRGLLDMMWGVLRLWGRPQMGWMDNVKRAFDGTSVE